ncbi:MAG: hypothetical protein AB4368_05160 [Xenococcaceae cyanobacterium]
MKSRLLFFGYSCLFSVSSILSFPQTTLAQLRIGRTVQPGLEGYFLEYQQTGLPLNELMSVSSCSVGLGASCNKTGAVLQKIVKEYSGSSYRELLMKAAGGLENYQRFARLYSNPAAISLTPYSSFWRDNNQYILDNHEYAGINIFQAIDSAELNEITSQFKYSPLSLRNSDISPRQGLIQLKVSYGVTLMEEALKVPDINQKIAEESLNESEASFHQQQFQTAVLAIKGESTSEISKSLFFVLSNPYTQVPGVLNRPNLNISTDLTSIHGIALEGDEETILSNTEENAVAILTNSFEETSFGETSFGETSFGETIEGFSTSYYTLAGLGGMALLIILLADGDGNAVPKAIAVDNSSLKNENEEITALPVPEPNDTNAFFIIMGIFFCFDPKKAKEV